MDDAERVIHQTVSEGGVYALLYFDMSGKEKEALQNLLVEFIARLSKEPGVVFAVGAIEEPVEYGEEYITSAEVKILTKNFNALINVCMQYSPFGVEVLQPDEVVLSLNDAQTLLLYVSQTAQTFARYVYEHVLTDEQRNAVIERLRARELLGKKLKEKGGGAGVLPSPPPST